ncbi:MULTISPECIES: hypothetical protein [Bacillus cereus group]|uniref:hypothetical protein n=1 Tax=Bacillus cereus group TaxID=86661 RepID=UPI0018CE60CA|nr:MULTISPECIES: hypothetical protein [Bacillus cereus group]MBG9841129.1 hypothetical protein [Bacillus tropicus]MBG9879679.1 hypothetical protein [Bacillus tropicus]MBG9922084.1 hypothetical protein [Bacillus tropicus]MBJ8356020.1 hypothetical protein [Bacillus mycoides]MED2903930.1 hypothetical protein [Bacillus tropicus]
MNEVQAFENKYLAVMTAIAIHTQQEKEHKENTKKLKAELEKAMDEHGIESIDNDLIKITRIKATTSTTIDVTKLKAEEPELYGELLGDYPKVSNRKAHVKFTVK